RPALRVVKLRRDLANRAAKLRPLRRIIDACGDDGEKRMDMIAGVGRAPRRRSRDSPAVEQEAVVLEQYAGDLARAHGAQEVSERDGGLGVGETFWADVGDAVALRVGGARRRPEGEIGAHAIERGEARPFAD